MTKRFTVNKDTIIDTETNTEYKLVWEFKAEQLCVLLNTQQTIINTYKTSNQLLKQTLDKEWKQ